MTEKLLLLLFVNVWIGISAQYSPYSLQAAVDALHRREAQLALKDNFSPHHYNLAQENDYWDDAQDADAPANRFNRLLARFLARENENDRSPPSNGYENDFEEDKYLPEDKKRSFFREREEKYDSPYQTPFREREAGSLSQPELAEQFLREVEQERELEWEEKYKETLRKLWEKYQQQENEIEQQLFNEEKRKHPMAGNIGPYYAGPPMERKRSYPVLPWLPASRKKRFPVAKRSPKMPMDEPTGADEKVAKDLQAIFGTESDDKKKRSTNEEPSEKEKPTDAPHDKKPSDSHNSGEHNHGHHHHGHDEEHAEDESDEHDQEHEHEHEHEHDQEDDDDDQDFDDDDEDRKKKRDVSAKKRSNQEIIREDQIIPGDLTDSRRKKSIQWSKYFGIDRRKKSDPWFMGANNNDPPKKQDYSPEIEEKSIKRDLDTDKLENMDDKLKTIEDLIIDETIKYTGAHEGISDPDEIRRLKDHVVSRLATAYSLEKMRRALEKLRQSVDNENHLQRNEIETSDSSKEKEKEKRVAIKKEKVQFDSNQHSLDTPQAEKSQEVQANNLEDSNEDKKKKKKRNNGIQKFPSVPNDVGDFEEELGAGHFEPLNEGYGVSGISRTYSPNINQCPLLDSMADRCRGVDILSGDIHQELLPVCGIHQLCYLCGTSQVSCDFQYLSEADSVCGRNSECQSAARSALMILRGAPGPQLGPKECLKNPCLYRAMREIGL